MLPSLIQPTGRIAGVTARSVNKPCVVSAVSAVSAQIRTFSSNNDHSDISLKEFVSRLHPPTIVTICGSQREGSFNRMLHDAAVESLKAKGATVKVIDLEELDLPLYNPNKEAVHFPEAAKMLKDELVGADGIFLSCPEYNGLMTPLLLNAITWATRGEGDMYAGFKGKFCSIMATSPGPMGGLRMVRSMQQFVQDMGGIVVPGFNSIGSSMKVFDEQGKVVDEMTQSKIDSATGQLMHFCHFEANRDCNDMVWEQMSKMSNMGEYGKVDH